MDDSTLNPKCDSSYNTISAYPSKMPMDGWYLCIGIFPSRKTIQALIPLLNLLSTYLWMATFLARNMIPDLIPLMNILSKYKEACSGHFNPVHIFWMITSHTRLGELTDEAAKKSSLDTISEFFIKINSFFFGVFDPKNNFFENKNRWFSGWPKRYFG